MCSSDLDAGLEAAQTCSRTQEPQRATIGLVDVAGDVHWFDVLFVYHSDDPDIGGVMIVARDITERVVAEDALQALDNRYTAMIAESPDLHVLLAIDLSPVWISASTLRFLGIGPEEPFVDALLASVPPVDLAAIGEDTRQIGRAHV